ncbi:MAG: hypothetical protein ACLFPF_03725 [Halanaerobiales bacterium]
MKRGTYKIEKEKHRELMKKFISDNMSFNEFLDRTVNMYLGDKYSIEKNNE